MTDTLYKTGMTPEGEPLIGGVWRLAHQDGFPLELSDVIARENGWRIDWLEALADASTDNNLPALMRQVESFMDSATIHRLKLGFQHVIGTQSKTYQQVVDEKRANGEQFERASR